MYYQCTHRGPKLRADFPLFEFKVTQRHHTDFLHQWMYRWTRASKLTRTYVLFIWHFMLLFCVHGTHSIPCSRDRNIPWRETPQVVTVEWLPDLVCTSSEDCYGTPDVFGGSFPAQLCPVEIQLGDSIQIVPSFSPFFAAFPANVTADTFVTCPDESTTQALVSQPTNDVIDISARALTAGIHYIAQINSVSSFIRCEFGMRVNITVKQSDCRGQGSSADCSGVGTCITQPQEGDFHCNCLPGYMGYYCDEFDGCYTQPCRNGGDCTDIVGGVQGMEYQCSCATGFTGKFNYIWAFPQKCQPRGQKLKIIISCQITF